MLTLSHKKNNANYKHLIKNKNYSYSHKYTLIINKLFTKINFHYLLDAFEITPQITESTVNTIFPLAIISNTYFMALHIIFNI